MSVRRLHFERLRSWSGPWMSSGTKNPPLSFARDVRFLCRKPGRFSAVSKPHLNFYGQKNAVSSAAYAAPLIGSQGVLTVGSFQMHKKKTNGQTHRRRDRGRRREPRCRLAIVWRCALASMTLHKNKSDSTNSRTPIQIGILAESSVGCTQATPPNSSKLLDWRRLRTHTPKPSLLRLWWQRKILAGVFEIRL